MSRLTSFVGVEIRADHEKADDKIVLRRIPVMLTKDWGGQKRGSLAKSRIMCGLDVQSNFSICDSMIVTQPQLKFRHASDGLILLLDAQQIEGGFAIGSSLAASEHWNLIEIANLAGRIIYKEKVNTLILIFTAIALAVLDSDFSDRRDEWESVVSKSVSWFKNELQRTQATIDGVSLDIWAKDYVKKLKPITNRVGRS